MLLTKLLRMVIALFETPVSEGIDWVRLPESAMYPGMAIREWSSNYNNFHWS
jgi:hypothetical protein